MNETYSSLGKVAFAKSKGFTAKDDRAWGAKGPNGVLMFIDEGSIQNVEGDTYRALVFDPSWNPPSHASTQSRVDQRIDQVDAVRRNLEKGWLAIYAANPGCPNDSIRKIQEKLRRVLRIEKDDRAKQWAYFEEQR